jgi:hypothetical protein
MTTGCPSRAEIFSPMVRPMMSAAPPGGNGMRKRIGRLGYFSYA